LERLAPPVPKQEFAKFMSRFSRGKAALPGGGFPGECLPQRQLESINRGDEELKQSLEVAQGQDWKWNQNQKREGFETPKQQPYLPNLNSKSESQRPEPTNPTDTLPELNQSARAVAAGAATSAPGGYSRCAGNSFRERDKSLAVTRELMVGQGPRCGPVRVKPEALDRIRAREGSRSP